MQNSILKCADAQHFIHLAVGDDTLPDEEQQLSEHLHQCSDCRAYHAGMVDAMHAIERVRDEEVADVDSGSVWPGLADKLASRRRVVPEQPRRRRFNGSIVALCACSLMLALITAVQNLPTVDSRDSFAGTIPAGAVTVSFQAGEEQPKLQQRLVQVEGPNGSVMFVDPVTKQTYVPGVPDLLNALPSDEGLRF